MCLRRCVEPDEAEATGPPRKSLEESDERKKHERG